MRKGLILAICLAVSLVGYGPAQAAISTIIGSDDGAGPGAPRPLSDAAAAAFDAVIGPHSTITFEGLPLGSFTSMTVFPGVTVTLTNTDPAYSKISNVQTPPPEPEGYNTTAGGSQYLMVSPIFGGGDLNVTFSLATPTSFFGAYLTGTDTSRQGTITLGFNDGSSQSLAVPKNGPGGGVEFFGFTDFGKAISSVTFTEAGPFVDSRDIWGIDDVRTNVPLPPTLLLLGSGLLGLAGLRRFRKA